MELFVIIILVLIYGLPALNIIHILDSSRANSRTDSGSYAPTGYKYKVIII